MATLAEIRQRTAKRLGRLGVGMTLSSADNSHLTSAYSELHAEWTELGIAVWASSADVPNKFSEPVIRALAARVADDFGVSNDRYQRIVSQGGQAAENMLRRLIAGEYQPDTTEFTDY